MADWAFKASTKVDEIRSVSLDDTFSRLRGFARQIPVTRLVDLTALDFLNLPVCSAVTPLARDLKVHLGKGESRLAARVSALMEAVERVTAETIWEPVMRACFEDLGTLGAVDPRGFDLPSGTAYRPDLPLDWVAGRDLIQNRDVLIPVDLAVNPPREGVLLDVDTNGLASGNSLLEAVIHAICEVVERDAISQLQFAASFADPYDQPPRQELIEVATLPVRSREWAERLANADIDLDVLDITTDVGVPTFEALLMDDHFPAPDGGFRPVAFFGLGTHPNAEVAVFHALAEAIQARVGLIQGARDSYNGDRGVPRPAAIAATHARTRYRRRRPFSDTRSFRSVDLLADLELLLNALASIGVRECVAVDLTHPKWGVPVVRARISGLSQYCVNKTRPGARCLRYLL